MSNCPLSHVLGEQLSGEHLSGEQLSGEQMSGEQLSGEQLSVVRLYTTKQASRQLGELPKSVNKLNCE